jgi:hypothetical protein
MGRREKKRKEGERKVGWWEKERRKGKRVGPRGEKKTEREVGWAAKGEREREG